MSFAQFELMKARPLSEILEHRPNFKISSSEHLAKCCNAANRVTVDV
jgi:hypothetical protein